MSGKHHGIIRQRQQASLYGLYKLPVVAPGKVGTADAALKQHIAYNHKFLCLAI